MFLLKIGRCTLCNITVVNVQSRQGFFFRLFLNEFNMVRASLTTACLLFLILFLCTFLSLVCKSSCNRLTHKYKFLTEHSIKHSDKYTCIKLLRYLPTQTNVHTCINTLIHRDKSNKLRQNVIHTCKSSISCSRPLMSFSTINRGDTVTIKWSLFFSGRITINGSP